jgi:hypothetical protein
MEKTLTEAAQLLQKISRAAAMRRDWETRLAKELEYNLRRTHQVKNYPES